MAIPREILAVERPRNTFVIAYGKDKRLYAVRRYIGCRREGGRNIPVKGPTVGHIRDGRYIPTEEDPAFAPTPPPAVELKDWANTRHTYGEYVFTRAHMYHEMVRCALQLRCHAEEIGAFRHAPNPPFRILHSLPSLAERDPYVRSLYGLYGACSFTGWATRFLTERHLAKGDFKGAKVVVVPDARRVSDVTFKALEAFSRKGGIVLVDGDLALARDQWGKSAPERAAAIRRFRRFPSVASRARFEALNAALAEKGVQPPLALTTADGKPPFGVMWRTARTAKGDEVVFIANLSRSPVEICMPGAWTDVLAQEAKMPSRFSLEPCGLKICRRPR